MLNPENAFPTSFGSPGMTLRDWFASQALIGLLSRDSFNVSVEGYSEFINSEKIAFFAYHIADNMMRQRDAKAEGRQ